MWDEVRCGIGHIVSDLVRKKGHCSQQLKDLSSFHVVVVIVVWKRQRGWCVGMVVDRD